jgi:hypothetical protein
VSLPGPLPYEAPRSGSLREAPVKRAMRPYAERLSQSQELVRDVKVEKGSLRESGLTVAQVALFLGAVLPIIASIPEFGPLLFGYLPGLNVMGYGSLALGWWGALLVVVAGVAGVFVMRFASWKPGSKSVEVRVLRLSFYALTVGLASLLLLALAPLGANGNAVLGAVMMLTILLGLYGCWCTARRQNWLGAFVGAVAVAMVTSALFGTVAAVLIVWGARAFPGQTVARNPWKRTEVAIEPIERKPELERAEDDGVHPHARAPFHQGLLLAKVALVFGAFAPFVLALPFFGIELFGPLIGLFSPLTDFVVWSGASIQASFIILFNAGGHASLVPGAVLTLLWLLVVPVVGGVVGARAVGRRERPMAAVAGGALLLVGGRLFFGLGALLLIGYTWRLFNAHKHVDGGEAPKDGAPSPSVH